MAGEVRSEPHELDEKWMTEALEGVGVARGATVTSVKVEGFIGTGQTGRNARLLLEWDDPLDRPASLVGKFPSGDPAARASAFEHGTYLTEWEFYNDLASTLAVRAPQCHVARYDGEALAFVLLMEDLAGSRQGDQFLGLTLDEAALGVQQAVGLHAPRWGDSTLSAFSTHLPKGDAAAARLGDIYGITMEPFLDRLGGFLDDDIVAMVRAFAPKATSWAAGPDTPVTVVHRDFRPDNFMFGVQPDAPPLVIVDWQTASEGNAMLDLAYMIGGAFNPEDRAAAERSLLQDYLARLHATGVAYDAETMWRDYRLGSLWGVMMTVIATILAAETERGNEMLTVMAQRHGRHALDLAALDLVS